MPSVYHQFCYSFAMDPLHSLLILLTCLKVSVLLFCWPNTAVLVTTAVLVSISQHGEVKEHRPANNQNKD